MGEKSSTSVAHIDVQLVAPAKAARGASKGGFYIFELQVAGGVYR